MNFPTWTQTIEAQVDVGPTLTADSFQLSTLAQSAFSPPLTALFVWVLCFQCWGLSPASSPWAVSLALCLLLFWPRVSRLTKSGSCPGYAPIWHPPASASQSAGLTFVPPHLTPWQFFVDLDVIRNTLYTPEVWRVLQVEPRPHTSLFPA